MQKHHRKAKIAKLTTSNLYISGRLCQAKWSIWKWYWRNAESDSIK